LQDITRIHAYQLKSGNVSLPNWRNTIRGEIEALCELPIRHPSIDRNAEFDAFLVCSGDIDDSVRNDIVTLNDRLEHRGVAPLKTITGGELLTRFILAHGSFFPVEPDDFHEFLGLFLSDGKELLNKEGVSQFLHGFLRFDSPEKSARRQGRRLSAACILFGYLLGRHYECNNHLAVAEGWLLFALHVAGFAEANELADHHWRKTFELALKGMEAGLQALSEEALTREHFSEGDLFVDGPVYRYRQTLVAGWVAAWEIYRRCRGQEPSEERQDYVVSLLDQLTISSEAAVPVVLSALLLAGRRGNLALQVENRIGGIVYEICRTNAPDSEPPGICNSYYGIAETIEFGCGSFHPTGENTHDIAAFA
jgi:hypothetical protein